MRFQAFVVFLNPYRNLYFISVIDSRTVGNVRDYRPPIFLIREWDYEKIFKRSNLLLRSILNMVRLLKEDV